MNQLTVLGGSAAGVGTGQGCSSYLIQTDETTIVHDMGPNTLLELRKHTNFRTLDGIVISHLHLDHLLDLFALRFMLSYNPVKAEKTIPLHLPPGGLAFLEKAADLFATDDDDVADYFSAVFEMSEYDPEAMLPIADIEIRFAPTIHIIPCWAIRVQPKGSDALLFTADTGTDSDLTAIAAGAAVIVADSASGPDAPKKAKQTIHYDAVAAAQLAETAGCQHLVLSHQWEENDPVRNAAIAGEHYQGRISIATPGLTVTW